MKDDNYEIISCYLCGEMNYETVHNFKQEKGEWKLVKCHNCRFVFHSPRLKEGLAIGGYDNKNEFADIVHAKCDVDEYIKDYLKEESLKRFEWELDNIETLKKSPGMVLDVGSGPGTFIMLAKKRGWDGIGVDIASWCKEAGEKIGVEIKIGNINEGIFPSNTFDVSFSYSALEHFYNPLKTLTEIYRCLKPGGVSVTSGLVNYNSIERKLGFNNYWEHNKPPAVVSQWTVETMRLMHEKAGFSNIRIECEWIKSRAIWACLYPVKPIANYVLNKCGLGTSLRVVATK